MVELQSLFWVSGLKGEQVLQNLGKDAAGKERERESERENNKMTNFECNSREKTKNVS